MNSHVTHLRLYLVVGLVAWSIMLIGLLWWQGKQLHSSAIELAYKEAYANFNKDQAFRNWASMHGGVYVPVSEKTPRNEYLSHINERDIVSPSGKQLTLMNPAYMLRQLNEHFGDLVGVRGHITSRLPLRPENGPDAWEEKALFAFEEGAKEVVEQTVLNDEPYLRFMRPMVVAKPCLKCHEHQGYKEGDIRGGVSISVPLHAYLKSETDNYQDAMVSLIALWLLGVVTLVLAYVRLAAGAIEQQKTAEEIKRLNEGLEVRVSKRTEELVEAKDEAEAANYAKSVFLANMSHELRTPLNAVLGFSKLLQDDPLATELQRQNLSIINHSGEHLLTLINDILEMSKIEAGRVQVEEKQIDLDDLMHEIILMMTLRAEEKGLKLQFEQPSNSPHYILADALKLRQVLINLLSNAIKFTEEGEVNLRLEVESLRDENKLKLIYEVEDSGIGLSAEEKQLIFKPFVQVGLADMRTGTGLGLSITQQYINLMGGQLDVVSEQGKGSTFTASIIVESVEGKDVEKVKATTGRVIGLQLGQPEFRILSVEDKWENELLLQNILRPLGFKLKSVQNGEEAITAFKEWKPDLIWMDRRMPVMDGLEATRRIRAMQDGDDVIIIALTASVFSDQVNEVLQAGSDDFIRKPYKPQDIYGALAKYLGVRYLYAENLETENGTKYDLEELKKALDDFPDEWIEKLRIAVLELDVEQTSAIIEQINDNSPKIASALSQLLETLDFMALQKILDNKT